MERFVYQGPTKPRNYKTDKEECIKLQSWSPLQHFASQGRKRPEQPQTGNMQVI